MLPLLDMPWLRLASYHFQLFINPKEHRILKNVIEIEELVEFELLNLFAGCNWHFILLKKHHPNNGMVLIYVIVNMFCGTICKTRSSGV